MRGMNRLSVLLAFSHLRRRRTQNILSILGVAIGVMVLTTAMSLTNGFVKALIDTTIRALPHLDVRSWNAMSGGDRRNTELEAFLSNDKTVLGWAPYTVTKGILLRRGSSGRSTSTDFVTVYGVDGPRQAGALSLKPEEQRLLSSLPTDGILIGEELARSIGAFRDDMVLMFVAPSGAALDLSSVKRKAFRVVGTYRTGNALIDAAIAFVPLAALQELTGNTGKVIGYHVKLRDPERAEVYGYDLANTFRNIDPRPWQQINQTLIEQMRLQKSIITIVLLLIVIVAVFGIINVLVLTVFEKTPEIAILRAMGASSRAVQGVFLIEGLILGIGGLLLGNALGLGLSYYFKLQPFVIPGSLYFITALSPEIRAWDFVWVSLASLVTTVLAALIPARRAAGIEPAKIIR
jgi:lipoprotein-releasing system permease protein